jgi:hypothetical protein
VNQPPLLLNSITDAGTSARGRVVVSGSHGGLYPAAIASKSGVHAVIFNDAGIGFEQAGIAGIRALETCGMAAAAADCMSAEIGSSEDMIKNGTINFANVCALAVGVNPGMSVVEAASLLAAADPAHSQMEQVPEARWDEELPSQPNAILCVDSASLVLATDAGRTIVTGSHGGLIGGDPKRALKAMGKLAVFNDAGGGKNSIGTSRLPALQSQGIAAVTVSHNSCRIGDAASVLQSGIISAANQKAREIGASEELPLWDFLLF